MKSMLALLAVAVLATTVLAADLGSRASAKPTANHVPPPVDPAVIRQGGDTILDAVPLTLPTFNLVGTTAGYTDDYDEICPYDMSTSPDVVYTFTPPADMNVDVDLYGSAYDTKVYIYDADLNLIACNDDYYADYTSKLEQLPVAGGMQYYLVIDGYGGDAGQYLLTFMQTPWGVLECPAGGTLEGEPPLEWEYVDTFNGGCDTDPANPPIQPLVDQTFCGVSGWYLDMGAETRDTDWFAVAIPGDGTIEIVGDAEQACLLQELGPLDCDTVEVLQTVTMGPLMPATLTVVGEPGSTTWLRVWPLSPHAPGGADLYEFDYVLLHDHVYPVEQRSLTGVKNLFR